MRPKTVILGVVGVVAVVGAVTVGVVLGHPSVSNATSAAFQHPQSSTPTAPLDADTPPLAPPVSPTSPPRSTSVSGAVSDSVQNGQCQSAQLTAVNTVSGEDPGTLNMAAWSVARAFVNTGSQCALAVPATVQVTGADGGTKTISAWRNSQSVEVAHGQRVAVGIIAEWWDAVNTPNPTPCVVAETNVTSVSFAFGGATETYSVDPAWQSTCTTPQNTGFDVELNPSF